MALALFDLDHTLIAGDSDQLWGEYLYEQRRVGEDYPNRKNAYYRAYLDGNLDFPEFARFVLEPLARLPLAELLQLRAGYARDKLYPVLLPAARRCIEEHRAQGDRILIITATNRFIAEPAAAYFGVADLIATEAERQDGRFTGELAGIPSFREGKIARLDAWLAEHGGSREDAWFYSDSRNDIPLLEAVARPVAVDPDPVLRAEAQRRSWPIRSFREA